MDVTQTLWRDNPLALGGGLTLTYLIWSFCLFVIANREKEEYAWISFVPILNLFMFCKLGKFNPLWWLLCFTCVGIPLVLAWAWARVAKETGSSPILGWLTLVPCLGWMMPILITATGDKKG
jgi:hypothetical protein